MLHRGNKPTTRRKSLVANVAYIPSPSWLVCDPPFHTERLSPVHQPMYNQENDMPFRPVTRALLPKLVAGPESRGDENTEFLCCHDNWANHCDALLAKCEEDLLELGDNAGLSSDPGTDPGSDAEEIDETELQSPNGPAFDNGYFGPEDSNSGPKGRKRAVRIKCGSNVVRTDGRKRDSKMR